MKTIKLTIKKEKVGNKEMYFSDYDLLKIAINNTPQNGFSVEEMQKRLRLTTELEKHKDLFEFSESEYNDSYLTREAELLLEDSDFTKLKELMNECKWTIVAKCIVDLHAQFQEKK